MRGWHPDVDDGHVGTGGADLAQQVGRVAGLADDLEPRLREQAGDALAKEQGVVGEDDPQAHAGGTRARMAAPDSSSFGMNPSTRLLARRGP